MKYSAAVASVFIFHLLLLLLLLPTAASTNNADDALDYISCLHNGQCGLDRVCTFSLLAGGNMSGTLLRLSNGLNRTLVFTWSVFTDVTSSSSSSCGSSSSLDAVDHPSSSRLAPNGVTYINTHCVDTHHGLALYVADQVVALRRMLYELPACAAPQACHHLHRACADHATSDPACLDGSYTVACASSAGNLTTEDRDMCIPNCLALYYADLFIDPYRYMSSSLVAVLASEYARRLSGAEQQQQKGSDAAAAACHDSSYLAGLISMAVLGVAVTGGFAYLATLRFCPGCRCRKATTHPYQPANASSSGRTCLRGARCFCCGQRRIGVIDMATM